MNIGEERAQQAADGDAEVLKDRERLSVTLSVNRSFSAGSAGGWEFGR